MADWYLANIDVNRTLNVFPHALPPIAVNETTLQADLQGLDDGTPQIVYFGAPQYYLGEYIYYPLMKYDENCIK